MMTKLPCMKTKTIYLILLSLLLTSTSVVADKLALRYADQRDTTRLTVSQVIDAGKEQRIQVSRDLSMSLKLNTNKLNTKSHDDQISVTIADAKGSFTAHGNKMRLGTSHIKGKIFNLDMIDQGLMLKPSGEEKVLAMDMGQILPKGFPISWALDQALPILPSSLVDIGSQWTTEREMKLLVGWSWTVGTLSTTHIVTDIKHHDGRTLVSVESQALASLGTMEGARQYEESNQLAQKAEWVFDETHGRLVSLSMTQEAHGASSLPQGMVPVDQVTKVVFSVTD
jgi:hypothetical protein